MLFPVSEVGMRIDISSKILGSAGITGPGTTWCWVSWDPLIQSDSLSLWVTVLPLMLGYMRRNSFLEEEAIIRRQKSV